MKLLNCVLCNAPLEGKQRKYCQTCVALQSKKLQRQTVLRSKHKERRPDWTEEDWQLQKQRKATTKQAKAQAALLRQRRSKRDEERQQEWHLKRARVYQRRRKGKVVCYWCEKEIPPETIKARRRKELPKYCNRTCFSAWKKYFGFYQRFSSYGNEAQANYKVVVGTIPSYEKRRTAVIKANKEQPKRRKKSIEADQSDGFLAFLVETETE